MITLNYNHTNPKDSIKMMRIIEFPHQKVTQKNVIQSHVLKQEKHTSSKFNYLQKYRFRYSRFYNFTYIYVLCLTS